MRLGFEIKKTVIQIDPSTQVEDRSFLIVSRQQGLAVSLNGGYETIVQIRVGSKFFEATNFSDLFQIYPTISLAIAGHKICVNRFMEDIRLSFPEAAIVSDELCLGGDQISQLRNSKVIYHNQTIQQEGRSNE